MSGLQASNGGTHSDGTARSKARPAKVFISHSEKDSEYIEQLESHLSILRREGLVDHWRQRCVLPGDSLTTQVDAHLDEADIIILAISADFFASDYLHDAHISRALARDMAGSARVIPLILRAVEWKSTALGRFQPLPDDGEPINSREDKDSAWFDVVRGLMQILETTSPSSVLPGEDAGSLRPNELDPPCPFPGLAFFDEERAADFFGREAEVGDVLAKLAAPGPPLRWLQIDGPSGAGKSSFARAGIVPAVRAGKLAGRAEAWVTAVLRPGHDPIANLAEAMLKQAKPPLAIQRSLDEVTRDLSASPTALKSLLRESVPRGHGVLLLVDQLEETFTLAHPSEGSVKQFDALLAAALDDEDRPFVLVTTIRSDFVAKMGELPALEERLSKLQVVRFYLPEMDEAELRRAIEKPAERAGLSYEPGLIDRIVEDASTSRGAADDASTSRGALPMVAHVLEALYTRREGRTLKLGAYELVGRVGGALAKSADAVIDGLDDQDRGRAQKLLLRLVKVGRGSENTRQTASREAALGAAGGGPEAERVLERLSSGRAKGLARLVVVSREAGNERVDLAHDALIHQWATLRDWIKNERKTLELRDDVEDSTRIWEASGRHESLLPRSAPLERLALADRTSLTGPAREYLRAAEQKQEAAERRQRLLVAGLVALVIGLFILASRAILLVREQEASKRAQIRQANMNMAVMVAGTVLSQLRAYSDAVERVASNEELSRALQDGDVATLKRLSESTYEFYDDPSHGLTRNGISPLDMWLILDRDGVVKAQRGNPIVNVSLEKEYAWRDYFKGASGVAEKKTHVSRVFRSENDGFYKFAISAPIYGSDKQPIGVIAAGVASNANLGSLVKDDAPSIAVLVAPRDRDRNEPRPEFPYVILRHPAIEYGEGIGMDNEQVRKVSEADLGSEERTEWQLWPADPGRVTSSDKYEDPVAKARPEYAGRWLSGFAPVGNTGFVVIVQTREAEATSEMNLVWQLAKWAGISSIPAALILLFTAWSGRRLRSARASPSPVKRERGSP
jgi:hypothetical protein